MRLLWLVNRGGRDPEGFGFSSNFFEIQKGCEFQADIYGIHLEPYSRDAFLKSAHQDESFDAAISVGSGMPEALVAKWDEYVKKVPGFLVYRDIRSDEEKDVPLLVEHLAQKGSRKIGFFGLDEQPYTHRRFKAFAETIRRLKLETRTSWMSRHSWTGPEVGTAYRAWSILMAKDFLSRASGMDAVVGETDRAAAAICEAAIELGLKIPSDLAVTGFDDARLTVRPWGYNALTTIRQDYFGMGAGVVRLAWECVREKKKNPGTLLIPGRLIVRQSSLRTGDPELEAFKSRCETYLMAHLDEKDSSRRLADYHNLSQAYFLIKFQKAFREGFSNCLNRLRAEKAAALLRTTPLSIRDVALRLGFASATHLSQFFKRRYRETPARFRKFSLLRQS